MYFERDLRRNEGFTLVELVIVLAIIAILAALTLSRLSYHQMRSRNAACNGIMEQVKEAAEAYYAQTDFMLQGPAAVVDENSPLITEGFMVGLPKHTHVSQGGHYTIAWDLQSAVVSCPDNSDTFPPGHQF